MAVAKLNQEDLVKHFKAFKVFLLLVFWIITDQEVFQVLGFAWSTNPNFS